MVDTKTAKVVHLREQLPATEEPVIDAEGNDVWISGQPYIIKSRDLLYDSFFGLRADGQQQWLTFEPESSGYATAPPSPRSGSGVIRYVQNAQGLELTTFVFAPQSLPHAAFVMALRARNTGSVSVRNVSLFSLHNFRLGTGRPGVMENLSGENESISIESDRRIVESGFAGRVVIAPLGVPMRVSAWNLASALNENGYEVVRGGGTTDLVNQSGTLGSANDWASAYQFDVGDIAPGEEQWVGLVASHSGNPLGALDIETSLDTYINSRTAAELVSAEVQYWASVQQTLSIPLGLSTDEAAVYRQSAAFLLMAQVKSNELYVREWLSNETEPRRSRFSVVGGGALPGVVLHHGGGAVLASLPPGEWTYAWIRDGAYAAVALSTLGRTAEAQDALRFFLQALGGRFESWSELQAYNFPPYLISLTRYTGFGVEETDFNAYGPNLEFDGFGLFLWALGSHETLTSDLSLVNDNWEIIRSKIADVLVALVDPQTGLIRKDSSIWETHWNGRERAWTYTNITAARGLCDAATLAERQGDLASAQLYRQTAERLRRAIATSLTDSTGALVSNREELTSRRGYFDAAVWDAIAMGLFDPKGRIAHATAQALDARLHVKAGPGWSRNDDRSDHPAASDLSPWGSEYDSAEWVVTDLRGSLALHAMHQDERSQSILQWTTAQASKNADVISETYDENTGAMKFNAPMIGFGAGVYALALYGRSAAAIAPACGAFLDESTLPPPPDGGTDGDNDAGIETPDASTPNAGIRTYYDGGYQRPDEIPNDCGCKTSPGTVMLASLWVLAALRLRQSTQRIPKADAAFAMRASNVYSETSVPTSRR